MEFFKNEVDDESCDSYKSGGSSESDSIWITVN
jgi:hypothetical protein